MRISEALLEFYRNNPDKVSHIKFWENSILAMLYKVAHDIEDLVIPEDWPMNKSKISFIRTADDTKFIMYMKKSGEIMALAVKNNRYGAYKNNS